MTDNQHLLLTTPLAAFFDQKTDVQLIKRLSQAIAKEAVLDFLETAQEQGLYANLEVGELNNQRETDIFDLYQQLLEANVPLFISILVERKKTAIVMSYQQQLVDLQAMSESLGKPLPAVQHRLQKAQQMLALLEAEDFRAVAAAQSRTK